MKHGGFLLDPFRKRWEEPHKRLLPLHDYFRLFPTGSRSGFFFAFFLALFSALIRLDIDRLGGLGQLFIRRDFLLECLVKERRRILVSEQLREGLHRSVGRYFVVFDPLGGGNGVGNPSLRAPRLR